MLQCIQTDHADSCSTTSLQSLSAVEIQSRGNPNIDVNNGHHQHCEVDLRLSLFQPIFWKALQGRLKIQTAHSLQVLAMSTAQAQGATHKCLRSFSLCRCLVPVSSQNMTKIPKYHKSWSQFSVAHCLTFWSRCVIYLERVWLTQRTVQRRGSHIDVNHEGGIPGRNTDWVCLSMSKEMRLLSETGGCKGDGRGHWKEALIIPHWESCRQNHRKKMCWKNMENMEKKHHVLIIYIPEVSAGRQIQIAQLYGFHSTVPTTMKLMEMFRLKRPGSSSICSARSPTPAQNITKSPEDWNLANSQIAIWAWSSDKRVDQQCDCDVFLTTSCRIQRCILYTFVSFWLSEFCCQKRNSQFSVFCKMMYNHKVLLCFIQIPKTKFLRHLSV